MLNRIFDYLSDISDSGWSLRATNNGKIILSAKPLFVDIHHLFRFKSQVTARQVNLAIQKWSMFHMHPADIGGGNGVVVSAIEHPHRIHKQKIIDANRKLGISYDNRCYTYTDPETEQNMVAYVEIRKSHLTTTPTFQQGCLYDAAGVSKVVSGFSSDETLGSARIIVNPYGIVWNLDVEDQFELDYYGNPFWDEEEEENDIDALIMAQDPLQMYM